MRLDDVLTRKGRDASRQGPLSFQVPGGPPMLPTLFKAGILSALKLPTPIQVPPTVLPSISKATRALLGQLLEDKPDLSRVAQFIGAQNTALFVREFIDVIKSVKGQATARQFALDWLRSQPRGAPESSAADLEPPSALRDLEAKEALHGLTAGEKEIKDWLEAERAREEFRLTSLSDLEGRGVKEATVYGESDGESYWQEGTFPLDVIRRFYNEDRVSLIRQLRTGEWEIYIYAPDFNPFSPDAPITVFFTDGEFIENLTLKDIASRYQYQGVPHMRDNRLVLENVPWQLRAAELGRQSAESPAWVYAILTPPNWTPENIAKAFELEAILLRGFLTKAQINRAHSLVEELTGIVNRAWLENIKRKLSGPPRNGSGP